MQGHVVKVIKSAETPDRSELLAWKLAMVAADDAPLDADVRDMIVNRGIANPGAPSLPRRAG